MTKRAVLTVSIVAILIVSLFVRIYRVSDISMLYTLADGDLVLVENISAGIHVPSYFFYVDKHIYDREKGIRRGDLLAFRHPLEGRLYLKRCVALPGDRIFQKEKNLFLQIGADSNKSCLLAKKAGIETYRDEDGCWLKNPYSGYYKITHKKEVSGPVELIDYPKTLIPPHNYFFMGDFRDNSTDSRFFGPVDYDRIYYKVFMIIGRGRSLDDLLRVKWL